MSVFASVFVATCRPLTSFLNAASTDAEGNVTKTEYDALGKTIATIDALTSRNWFRIVFWIAMAIAFAALDYMGQRRRMSSR